MATVIIYPNADGTLTSWTNELGATSNRYQSVDEGTDSPNDTDFINCSTQNTNGFLQLGNMPSDFGTATAVAIKMRTKSGTKGDYIGWGNCQIVAANEVDFITNAISMDDGNIWPTTYTYNANLFVTNKSGWDGAVLKFNTASGTTSSVHLYAVQIEITYTPTAGSTYNETGSGGSSAAGSATISKACNITGSGGSSAAGSATILNINNITVSGGVSASGIADFVEIIPNIDASGGASISGTASVNVKIGIIFSGGASISGTASVSLSGEIENNDTYDESTYYPDIITMQKLRLFKIKLINMIRKEGFDY